MIERYKLNQNVLNACLAKIINDLKINPSDYKVIKLKLNNKKNFKVLLSIPQNIPTIFVCDLLKTLLNQTHFKVI